MTTALVEKVRWPIDSAGSLMLQFDKYGFVRRFSEVDAAIKALFAAGEQGVWYDPSDIAVASILFGPELITNGDLSAGTTGWTPFNSEAEGTLASISVVNGRLRVTNSQSFQGWCYQYITGLTVGKTYRIEVDAYVGTAPVKIEFYNFYSQPTAATNVTSSTVSGKLVLNAVATNTGMQLKLYVGSSISGQYAEYDNITVKEATTTYSGGTLFQDAAGTTPVTAVEQPVGLMLDKSKGLVLGPELITNSVNRDFSSVGNWTVGGTGANAGTSISGGTLNFSSAADGKYAYLPPANSGFVPLKRLRVTFTISDYVSGGVKIHDMNLNASNVVSGNGYKSVDIFTAASCNGMGVMASGVTTLSVDNISVRELPGNHAYQTTSTSRPVLSARVNLLTKTEDFGDAVWTKAANGTGSAPAVTPNAGIAPNGTNTADRIVFSKGAGTTTADYSLVGQININVGSGGTGSVYLKSNTGLPQTVMMYTVESVSVAVATITVGNEWVKLSSTLSTAITTGGIYIGTRGGAAFGGDSDLDVLVWGASLVPANQASLPYQRVNTATDYDADPAKFPHYLRFDGVDDFLVTNSINFTATDEMTVFAGVRKLSDAQIYAVVIELSVNWNQNSGSFALFAPNEAAGTYGSSARGSADAAFSQYAIASGVFAPDTAALSLTHDISGDLSTLRRNGAARASGTGDKGAGNFGNYAMHIGARAGPSRCFNGHLYSLIVRGAQSTEQQIIDAEKYVNDKTRAYA